VTAFVQGKPVVTKVPTVVVDAGIKPGKHRFTLVVSDAAGNESKPDELVVVIREGDAPPPIGLRRGARSRSRK